MPGLFLIFVALVVFGIVMAIRRRGVAQDRVEQWAQLNGFELLFQQRRTFFQGPFGWTTSKYQIVYEISVRDREGKFREGYVRVGGWLVGMMSDNFEVRWKDEQ